MDPSQYNLYSLITSAQAGEETSVGELFERFHQAIYRFLAYRVGSKEDAEDLTQTVFLEMVKSLPQYRPRQNASFSSWLFRIARHRLIDHYRRQKTTLPLDDLNPADHPNLQTGAVVPESDTRIKHIRRHMQQLPEKYQTILHLTILEGFELHEAALAMDISNLHARVLKHRAIKKLKTLMPENSFIYEPA